MQLKKYEVDGISEAIIRIKEDLGPDAIILSSRRIGRGASSRIEVVAALEREGYETNRPDKGSGGPGQSRRVAPERTEPYQWKRFEDRLEEMRWKNPGTDVPTTGGGGEEKKDLFPLYRLLLSRGFSPHSASRLVEMIEVERAGRGMGHRRMDQRRMLRRAVFHSIAGMWDGEEENCRIQAFIGPAGDGKTTTLVKIAAGILYREKKTLGIITMDDFRIGATEQLKIYGRIMDVPVLVVPERGSLKAALRKFDHLDYVLVDTPGGSRCDEVHFDRLRRSFNEGVSLGTNLVVSATAEAEAMADTVQRFKPLDFNRVIVTKIDDVRRFGCLYNVIDLAGRPISHVTTGRQVPQDIRVVDARTIAGLVVDGEMPTN